MPFWVLAVVVNAIVGLSYFAIAGIVGRGIHATGQWRTNPLAVATFLIFLSCGIGHATHVEHLLLPGTVGEASRTAFDPHLVIVDAVTACVAIYYVMLRRSFSTLLQSPAMFDDLSRQRQQALDIHDNIVQQLATAKLAYETGHEELGHAALVQGLESSKAIITRMIGEDGDSEATGEAGGLRRETSARAT